MVRRTLEVAFAVIALVSAAVVTGFSVAWVVQTRAARR